MSLIARRAMGAGLFESPILPLSLNFANYADGPLPRLTGATWAISSGKAVNAPTLGSELLTDGGLENWTSDTNLTSWGESIAGASTINKESTDKHGGSFSARGDVDGSNNQAQIYQQIVFPTKAWVSLEYWRKASNGTATGGAESPEANIADAGWLLGTTWVKRANTGFTTTANMATYIRRASAANASIYFDDVSLKQITTNTLYAYFLANTPLVRLSANWIIQPASFAGVVACIDNPANPQNYVVCVHDGADRVRVIKCVAGTFTIVANTSGKNYVAGAAVELRHTATTTWQAWYDNAQVGTDLTIDDIGIVDNRYHGIFSANGGSQLNSFLAQLP